MTKMKLELRNAKIDGQDIFSEKQKKNKIHAHNIVVSIAILDF